MWTTPQILLRSLNHINMNQMSLKRRAEWKFYLCVLECFSHDKKKHSGVVRRIPDLFLLAGSVPSGQSGDLPESQYPHLCNGNSLLLPCVLGRSRWGLACDGALYIMRWGCLCRWGVGDSRKKKIISFPYLLACYVPKLDRLLCWSYLIWNLNLSCLVSEGGTECLNPEYLDL